ncbi:MAG: hypothetical protein P8P30_00630 [Rickettsiales bacterium]|nr:hypothetical protein [Rickettsiales bacterium]
MEDEPTIHPMGNARVDAAASRLNDAFVQVTQKLEYLQSQVSEHPEIDLLETENMRLHQETAELKSLLADTDTQLAQMAEQLTQMMEDAA